MQEPAIQLATITLLLIVSLAGLVYALRFDVEVIRYAAKVKRKDIQFWLEHRFAYDLNKLIIHELRERRSEDYNFIFQESPMKAPHQQWHGRYDD